MSPNTERQPITSANNADSDLPVNFGSLIFVFPVITPKSKELCCELGRSLIRLHKLIRVFASHKCHKISVYVVLPIYYNTFSTLHFLIPNVACQKTSEIFNL